MTAAALVLGLVLLVTGICLVNGARRIGEPFPGFLVAQNRTVLSVGRPGWSIESVPRAFFSQVIAVDGRPITRAREIQDASVAAANGPGAPVVHYRFRKGSQIFAAPIEGQRFTFGDFVAVYVTYSAVGLTFSLAGFWTLWRFRRRRPMPAAVHAFFVLCQMVGLALGTAGDVYGPYWFTPLYFTTQCATFASLVHFAISFPQPLAVGSRARRVGLGFLYGAAVLLSAGLLRSGDDVSLFVPLLYVVYLLLANAIVLYAASLAAGLSVTAEVEGRQGLRRALGGVLTALALPAMLFLVYPILEGSISPLFLVAPLALFPILTALGLTHEGALDATGRATSVRMRLSLLFLGAVETSFLIAVAVFWQSQSWAQLLDDVMLRQRQRSAVEQALSREILPADEGLRDVEELAQTIVEGDLATDARRAIQRGDLPTARMHLRTLASFYDAEMHKLEARRGWIAALAVPVLAILLFIAVLQAVAFTLAIRRWLIRPLDRVAAATNVIATGDLAHRLPPEPSEEFARLGQSVNTMAASLQAIQRRVELARAARDRAAGAARDAERRRLARELHDGILQDLSAVRLRLEDRASSGQELRSPVEAISGVIAALRGVVDDLRPPALAGVSLAEAIAGHARVLAWSQGVDLSLDLGGADQVPEWATRDLYRIAQEALANSLRHSGTKRLAIRLTACEPGIRLEVIDAGCGFEAERVPFGSGLQGMRERAALLGGDLEIETRPGQGTTIRLLLRSATVAPPRASA